VGSANPDSVNPTVDLLALPPLERTVAAMPSTTKGMTGVSRSRSLAAARGTGRRLLLVALAAAAVACSQPAAAPQLPAATDRCQAAELQPVQGGQHLMPNQKPPVPYNSTPPTSGWHTSGRVEVRVAPPEAPLTEPEQVAVLEAGAAVVSHRGLAPDQVEVLRRLAEERYPDMLAVTSYAKLGKGEVALTAWGVLQRCDGLDEAAITAFADAYALQASES